MRCFHPSLIALFVHRWPSHNGYRPASQQNRITRVIPIVHLSEWIVTHLSSRVSEFVLGDFLPVRLLENRILHAVNSSKRHYSNEILRELMTMGNTELVAANISSDNYSVFSRGVVRAGWVFSKQKVTQTLLSQCNWKKCESLSGIVYSRMSNGPVGRWKMKEGILGMLVTELLQSTSMHGTWCFALSSNTRRSWRSRRTSCRAKRKQEEMLPSARLRRRHRRRPRQRGSPNRQCCSLWPSSWCAHHNHMRHYSTLTRVTSSSCSWLAGGGGSAAEDGRASATTEMNAKWSKLAANAYLITANLFITQFPSLHFAHHYLLLIIDHLWVQFILKLFHF